MNDDPIVALSASRIKKAQSCSWAYWASYHLKIPDKGNDGSSRGSIVHLIFELMGQERRRSRVEAIIEKEDVFYDKPIARLILKHAKRLNVADGENMLLMSDMIVNGLKYNFYGEDKGKPDIAISEKDFDIIVNKDNIKYKIKGFIDKLFLYNDSYSALIRDFKTSKETFKGKDSTDNMQDYMYSLAVQHLYPEYTKRQSEFLFLKFNLNENDPKGGVIKMQPISDNDLKGFELQLTSIQAYLDNFSRTDAMANFAAKKSWPTDGSFSGPLQCGFAKYRGQLKKDGKPMYHCFAKFPFNYYVIKDSGGKIVKSIFEEDFDERKIEEDLSYERRRYLGCPVFRKSS